MDGARFRLVPFGPDGLPADDALTLSDELRANCAATAELYRSVSYAPPWIGCLPAFRRHVVGGGAFVGAPRDGRIEIAYFTPPDRRGRGVASRTAAALIAMARAAAPDVTILAKTLPEPGPSPMILSSFGFLRRRRGGSRDRPRLGVGASSRVHRRTFCGIEPNFAAGCSSSGEGTIETSPTPCPPSA